MGFAWKHIQELNPGMIVASVKDFSPGLYENSRVYENVAQCAGGAASTTGFFDGPPFMTGIQIGDSGTDVHLALGIVTALYQRKFEAMDILNKHDIPCGPILSMKKLAEDSSLRATGTMVEVDHPIRGKHLTVGNPI